MDPSLGLVKIPVERRLNLGLLAVLAILLLLVAVPPAVNLWSGYALIWFLGRKGSSQMRPGPTGFAPRWTRPHQGPV